MRVRACGLRLVLCLICSAVLFGWTALPARAAAPAGPQAIYDEGQAAYDKGDWPAASSAFAQLLPAAPQALAGRSKAVIACRYADSLLHLGHVQEAKLWVEAALPALTTADPGLKAEAWMVEGEVDRRLSDLPSAMEAYLKADALLTPE